MVMQRSSGFIEPCLPSKAARPPTGPLWVHENKHDGYRLMVRRDGPRVRCFTRNGHDWADHFLAIVEAAARFKAQSFLIDGEVAGLPSVAEPTPRCCSPQI
jgi:bifunctional non-homologous end joining protein LigD